MGGERPDPLLPLLPFPGWMHAGYPIMCHLESVQELINEKLIRTKGLWGPVHELGRNQQRQEWEFPPHTTEATCNLWCVYVHETVLGIPRGRANIALWPPVREKRVRIYLGKGPNVKNWNAWTALETYLQVLDQHRGGCGGSPTGGGILGRQYHGARGSPLTNLPLTPRLREALTKSRGEGPSG